MRRLLNPPLFVTAYAASVVVLVSVIAVLWAAHLPSGLQRALIGLNALCLARIVWLWARVVVNQRRGGY